MPRFCLAVMHDSRIQLQVIEGGSRLDRFLAATLPQFSRSAIRRLIDGGHISVNGGPAKASCRLRAGDLVLLDPPPVEPAPIDPEAVPLSIIYEDTALLMVDKPAGMVVHPSPGHHSGTLVNALLAHCPELASVGGDRPGIVHRLDRDTSGLIMVAKTEPVRRVLQKQFQEHRVHKAYLALLDGRLQPDWGRIVAPLDRDPQNRKRIAVQARGHDATTEYTVLDHFSQQTGSTVRDYTLVRAEPETGTSPTRSASTLPRLGMRSRATQHTAGGILRCRWSGSSCTPGSSGLSIQSRASRLSSKHPCRNLAAVLDLLKGTA